MSGGPRVGKLPEVLRGKLAVPERIVTPQTQKILYATALGLALAGAGFFLLALSDVLQKDDLSSWDGPVHSWFVSQRSPAVTVAMSVLAMVFGPVAMPIIVLAVTVFWTVTARHAWRPLLLAGAMLTGVILTQVITHLVARPRPPLDLMLLGSDYTSSFPSGHVLGVSDFLLVGAFLVFSRRQRMGPAIAGFLVAGVGVITQAVSRLYLGYHWLTDTFASIALSLIVLGAVIALDTWRTTRVPPS